MKYCSHCGKEVADEAKICIHCGCEVENTSPQIVINNSNNNTNTNTNGIIGGRYINKWIAFILCFFLGFFGVHKFYEGKIGTGVLYLCTFSFCGVGWFIDLITILCKPNPYLVI